MGSRMQPSLGRESQKPSFYRTADSLPCGACWPGLRVGLMGSFVYISLSDCSGVPQDTLDLFAAQ